MSRCATCRWWLDAVTRSEGDTAWRESEHAQSTESLVGEWRSYAGDEGGAAAEHFQVRFCASPALRIFERPGSPSGAAVVDGSEYLARLITGPEFGCVNWETVA